MVPGVFSTVIPFLIASPLLGLYLRLVTNRQFDEQPGGYQRPFQGFQQDIFRQVCAEIHSCRSKRFIGLAKNAGNG